MNEQRSVSGKMRLSAAILCISPSVFVHGHDFGLRGQRSVDWRTDQISRVIATRITNIAESGRVMTLDGKSCLQGSGFSFDVNDAYAFDLDETVNVDVEFYLRGKESKVQVRYERNGEAEAVRAGMIPAHAAGQRIHRHTFVLDRAR